MALRRRVKRDLTLVAGVVLILCIVVVVNYGSGVAKLASKFEALRSGIEEQRQAEGIELLSWKLMRATGGMLRTGATFVPELLEKDNTEVNVIGFMVPFEQFNHMTEFLLLPLPLECYFCQIPPARDVMFVQMKPGTDTKLYEEPVLLSGKIKLHKEAPTKFFYSLEDAAVGPAEAKGSLHPKALKQEHTLPQHENTGNLMPGYNPLAPNK